MSDDSLNITNDKHADITISLSVVITDNPERVGSLIAMLLKELAPESAERFATEMHQIFLDKAKAKPSDELENQNE